jgi:hypothetical protein
MERREANEEPDLHEQVQRQAQEDRDASSPVMGYIESVEPHAAESAAETGAAPDLNDLARRVYPLIKRMLAIERERLPKR